MAKINIRGLDKELANKGAKIFKPIVEQRAHQILKQQNALLMRKFEANSITQEIERGPEAANSSGTLGGVGNLFSFLGFERGDDPISPIRALLMNSIKVVSVRKQYKQLGVRLSFSVPTIEEIEEATGLPWAAGDSWVSALERGISNLGHYLFTRKEGKLKSSRSGTAIQSDLTIRSTSSSVPAAYITKLLDDMEKGIESSLRKM